MHYRPREWTVGLVGYGEVGRILAEDLRRQGVAICAYDIHLNETMRAHATKRSVEIVASHAMLAASSDLVISAVTAAQTLAAAQSVTPAMRKDAFFLDLNSASPNAKCEAAVCIDAAGGRYVEGAVMTSIPPYRQRVPLLLGGPHAGVLSPLLNEIGFSSKVHSTEVGVASAVKMCRSVMIKGLEAMVIESFTAARAYGVEDAVLASLCETFPGIDWEKQGAYFFQRAIEHGRRRAEEMRESARTVADTGLTPWSARGAAERQAWIADLAGDHVFGVKGDGVFARSQDWRAEADRILAAIAATRPPPA